MALEISSVEDTGMSMDSSGWTLTRQKIVESDSWVELYSGGAFPVVGSRHPKNINFRLESASMTQVGNEKGRIQVLWQGTYRKSTENENNANKEPWELEAQNVSVGYSTEQVPLLGGYDYKGKYKPLKNSAGCLISAETSKYITQLTFMYCVEASQKGEAPANDMPIINSQSEIVAGYTIPAGCGMLMPMSANFISEYDDEDPEQVNRMYWELSACIQINPRSWMKEFLDVGTMAKFSPDGYPEPIYQYQPEPDGITPVFGSINSVRKAMVEFKKKYNTDMSWTEVTDPLPLNSDGRIYTAALKSHQNEYNKIELFEFQPMSWRAFNFPKRRA